MAADDTAGNSAPDHLKEHAFKPGQSGNPAGRPKGSRVRLGEQFLSDVLDDWGSHGKQAIIDMREKNPGDYVKMVAATLPKELNVKVSELDELTDEQIARQLASVAAQLAAAGFDLGAGAGATETPQPTGGLPTLQ
jgi:hypothetical protein